MPTNLSPGYEGWKKKAQGTIGGSLDRSSIQLVY